ncbi:uncharacterized protein LOC143301367 isoform X1 [Babylonia areolata]|uniref:uncharacterized protein LOC143301367 isoform X1 n=1 Tax=Babylonia areolata TaxID=304850 RepID=UPI003FCF567D
MTTKRPMSAPKPNDVTAAIPRIVLDDRGSGGGGGGGGGDPTSTRPATLTHRPPAPNGPGVTTTTVAMTTTSTTMTMTSVAEPKESPDGAEYIPHRCNSDIGLPTSSMPNLTLALTLGEDGAGGRGKLGVYCSPRTTRRSVDLDVTSRDPAARAEYDWLEDKTSSLHVLSASSRVGSALSLNSVCTAHSVGLLSNDSDDDFQDTSINESSISEGLGGQGPGAGDTRPAGGGAGGSSRRGPAEEAAVVPGGGPRGAQRLRGDAPHLPLPLQPPGRAGGAYCTHCRRSRQPCACPRARAGADGGETEPAALRPGRVPSRPGWCAPSPPSSRSQGPEGETGGWEGRGQAEGGAAGGGGGEEGPHGQLRHRVGLHAGGSDQAVVGGHGQGFLVVLHLHRQRTWNCVGWREGGGGGREPVSNHV